MTPMHDPLQSGVAWSVGVLLGGVFFGGLWWTTREGLASPRPALWFFGSLLLRMSVTVLGFYAVARGHWERLLICLLGFVMARIVVLGVTRLGANRRTRPAPVGSHAP
jgi:F1F0 ATPase subunit 2